MSSPNYGSKDLKIKIPIEIVPEEQGIQEEIQNLQKSATLNLCVTQRGADWQQP